MKKFISVVVVLVIASAVFIFIRTRPKNTGGSVLWVASDTNGTLSSRPLNTNNFREVQTVAITNVPK